MHGNYEPHSSSWTLGCPLVWSYFYVTIRVKRYGWIMLNVQSKLTNLRMDCHHFCIFPWDFHGFSDFPLPWSGTAIFPGRLPWTKGPKTRWIHGESTVNRRANLNACDYICIQIYVSYCIYMSFICLFISDYRLLDMFKHVLNESNWTSFVFPFLLIHPHHPEEAFGDTVSAAYLPRHAVLP